MARWEPTAEQRRIVETMAGYGVPQGKIAASLRIAEKTLRRACRDELDRGASQAIGKIGETAYRIATGQVGNPVRDRAGNVVRDENDKIVYDIDWRSAATMCMFQLKCRAGFREKTEVEHSGSVDNPSAPSAIVILPDNGRG